jgi:hypothetical protein
VTSTLDVWAASIFLRKRWMSYGQTIKKEKKKASISFVLPDLMPSDLRSNLQSVGTFLISTML